MLLSENLEFNKLQQLKDKAKKILMMRQKRLPKLDSPGYNSILRVVEGVRFKTLSLCWGAQINPA